jgi:hypothetical protein
VYLKAKGQIEKEIQRNRDEKVFEICSSGIGDIQDYGAAEF